MRGGAMYALRGISTIMTSAIRSSTEKWIRDRRTGHRYPIDVEADYRLFRQGRLVQAGHGRTIDLSSSGVLFDAGRPLAPGMKIELSIHWPGRLSEGAALQLRVEGRTVRAQAGCTALRIMDYQFRTRATASTPLEAAGAAAGHG